MVWFFQRSLLYVADRREFLKTRDMRQFPRSNIIIRKRKVHKCSFSAFGTKITINNPDIILKNI
jgi:hypothetical protein